MRFGTILIAVENMEKARAFYEEVLSQKVTLNLMDANVTFENRFTLQADFAGLVADPKLEIIAKSNNHELYFEEENMEDFLDHLETFPEIEYVHELREYPWGQRVIRFYDPDHHIVEVGESMESVFKHFQSEGMSLDEIAERTMHPVDFVKQFLK